MSEQSYQENVKRGVTGENTGTCYLASFDRISPRLGIRPETYEFYEQFQRMFYEVYDDNPLAVSIDTIRMFEETKSMFRRDLGVTSQKNIIELRANTEQELHSSLARLAIGGFRTAVMLDVEGLHAVGVVPVGEGQYDIKSTWSPFVDDEPVSLDQLYAYLELAPRQRKRDGARKTRRKTANISALPSEPRR